MSYFDYLEEIRAKITNSNLAQGLQDRLNAYFADLEADVVLSPITDIGELSRRYHSSFNNNSDSEQNRYVEEILQAIAEEFDMDMDSVEGTVSNIIQNMDEEVLPAFIKCVDNFVQEQAQIKRDKERRERIKELKRELEVLEQEEVQAQELGRGGQDEQERKYGKLI